MASSQEELPAIEAPVHVPGEDTPALDEISTLIRRYFPEEAWDEAERVQRCENGKRIANRTHTNNDARQTTDHGIFMINDYWQRHRFTNVEELWNAENNVRIAAQIYSESGWDRWTCKYVLGA